MLGHEVLGPEVLPSALCGRPLPVSPLTAPRKYKKTSKTPFFFPEPSTVCHWQRAGGINPARRLAQAQRCSPKCDGAVGVYLWHRHSSGTHLTHTPIPKARSVPLEFPCPPLLAPSMQPEVFWGGIPRIWAPGAEHSPPPFWDQKFGVP